MSRNSADQREYHDLLTVLRGDKSLQPEILYLARFAFRTEREIKSFSEKLKIQELSLSGLKEMLKGTSSGKKSAIIRN